MGDLVELAGMRLPADLVLTPHTVQGLAGCLGWPQPTLQAVRAWMRKGILPSEKIGAGTLWGTTWGRFAAAVEGGILPPRRGTNAHRARVG